MKINKKILAISSAISFLAITSIAFAGVDALFTGLGETMHSVGMLSGIGASGLMKVGGNKGDESGSFINSKTMNALILVMVIGGGIGQTLGIGQDLFGNFLGGLVYGMILGTILTTIMKGIGSFGDRAVEAGTEKVFGEKGSEGDEEDREELKEEIEEKKEELGDVLKDYTKADDTEKAGFKSTAKSLIADLENLLDDGEDLLTAGEKKKVNQKIRKAKSAVS